MNGDWNKMEKLVVSKIEDLTKATDELREEVVGLKICVAKITVKSGLIGTLAAIISVAGYFVIANLIK